MNGVELVDILKTKRKDTTPLTIYVDGTLTPDNSGGANQFVVKDMENVSIIGVGNRGILDCIGIHIVHANNIIVRNLSIGYNRIGQKEGVSIQGASHLVWIDHNEIYNSLDADKDYYDELVSGKNQIDNITISYNYLQDSWKTSLWGSSDSDSYKRRVTSLSSATTGRLRTRVCLYFASGRDMLSITSMRISRAQRLIPAWVHG